MDDIRRISLPMSHDTARTLRAGEMVLLEGEIVITAGLPTHHRLIECARQKRPLPRVLTGAGFFHLGSYSRETPEGGMDVLYMNPTTSTRFNPLMPELIRTFGLAAVGGKGGLDATCAAAMQEVGCVYFSFVGGACPLLSDAITQVLAVDWGDLVSHYRLVTLKVRDLGPVVVGIDAHGTNLYADLHARALTKLPSIMDELAQARIAGSIEPTSRS